MAAAAAPRTHSAVPAAGAVLLMWSTEEDVHM
jgi:hypothetical protein